MTRKGHAEAWPFLLNDNARSGIRVTMQRDPHRKVASRSSLPTLGLAALAVGLSLSAAPGWLGAAQEPQPLFLIGEPDGTALEFGCADTGWASFAERFHQPVIFGSGSRYNMNQSGSFGFGYQI